MCGTYRMFVQLLEKLFCFLSLFFTIMLLVLTYFQVFLEAKICFWYLNKFI